MKEALEKTKRRWKGNIRTVIKETGVSVRNLAIRIAIISVLVNAVLKY